MQELQTISGIGPELAKKIYPKLQLKHEVSAEEMREILKKSPVFEELPIAAKADLLENPDKLVPHSVLEILEAELKKTLRGVKHAVAGSFRRNKPFSRDVDLVIMQKKEDVWDMILRKTSASKKIKFLKPFAHGPSKIATFVKVSAPNKTWIVKMDIFITNTQEFPFALLYATGSGDFNKRMRFVAKKRGMLLNQRGLYDATTKQPADLSSERDIFAALNMTYKQPYQRV